METTFYDKVYFGVYTASKMEVKTWVPTGQTLPVHLGTQSAKVETAAPKHRFSSSTALQERSQTIDIWVAGRIGSLRLATSARRQLCAGITNYNWLLSEANQPKEAQKS